MLDCASGSRERLQARERIAEVIDLADYDIPGYCLVRAPPNSGSWQPGSMSLQPGKDLAGRTWSRRAFLVQVKAIKI